MIKEIYFYITCNMIGRMFVVGTVVLGMPHHYWYVWLDRFIPRNDTKGVVLKILADQVKDENDCIKKLN